jgi:hypothetical protein
MEEKRCLALIEDKECGEPVTPVEGKPNVYQCSRGHRSVFLPVEVDTDPAKDA